MAKINGGHLAARYLKEVEKVDTYFTISGGHIEPILDGCAKQGIRAVDVRHEQAAAMMAHAWSIYKKTPGVCLVTAGPGFTNALTGIANAHLDNAPLVVLCGRHPIRDDLTGTLQEMNQMDMVKPITKWAATCFETKRIPEYLNTAFRQATEGRPGPVFLELPPDILFAEVEEKDVVLPRRKPHPVVVLPAESQMEAAAALLNQARKPVLIGGSGVGRSGCGEALTAFVDKTGIPFSLMNSGKGEISDEHPLCLGERGLTGVMAGLSQADLVVAVGIRFNWLLQFGQIFPEAKVVRIDIDPCEIDRNRAAEVGLVGDAGDILEKLTPLVKKRSHKAWHKDLATAARAFTYTEQELREKPSDPIHPHRLAGRIMEEFGTDAYYVADGGDTTYFAIAGFRSIHSAGVMTPAGALLGCLGTGLPFALAAKLARPDKPVILLQGDGSFGFNGMEFDTAVRHNIPIVCVVNNDCAWGMIKHSQEMSLGMDQTTCAELGMRHYEKVVEGLGGYGEMVTEDDQILPALKRAVESGRPACINVVTDPSVTSPATVLFYQSFNF